MQVVKSYPDGMFSWVDLSTPDLEKAKAFYSGLFGWEANDVDTGGGPFYTMFQIDGLNVAGGGIMPKERQEQGMPATWTSYITHRDVDGVMTRAKEAGATPLLEPMDVMKDGRLAIIQDPLGATFGVWQPYDHIGSQLVNIPNAFVWNELQTPDTEAARAFYAQIFEWEYQVDENGYVMAVDNGRAHAGMMQMDGENWEGVPPNWAVYFMVADLEASIAKVTELGGQIMVPATAAGEMGKFAVVRDPQGGVFTIMQFDGPVDAPPGH